MGVRGLLGNIINYAPNSITMTKLENYKGSIVAIDAEFLLYKFSSKDQESFNSSLNSFINFISSFLEQGIIPVFVFDGKSPISKIETNIKRREKKEQYKIRKQELTDLLDEKTRTNLSVLASKEESELIDKINKEDSNNPIVSYEYRNACKKLLSNLGIPIINTSCEAEVYCVKMLSTSMVDYIYGNDSDLIAYIIAQFIKRPELLYLERHFKIFMDKRETEFKIKKSSTYCIGSDFLEYDVHKILSSFDMTPEQFIIFCVLSGTDYNAYAERKPDLFNHVKKYDNLLEDKSCIDSYNTFVNPDDSLKHKEDILLKTDLHISKDKAVTTMTVLRPSIKPLTEENIKELTSFKDINISGMLIAMNKYSEKYNTGIDYIYAMIKINQ